MTRPAPPLSNAERQRQFRARHPNYYHRYRARMKAAIAALREAREANAAPVAAEPLALPAPAELPLFPGLNAIPATAARTAEPVPISQPATMPAPKSLAA